MAGFVEGVGRGQVSLFPAQLDDYVADDNPVRAVDAFVDGLELAKLGFTTEPLATGRPGYRPATMIKIYIYAYLNRIPSSRRIERECQRNIELIWLTGKLAPDHKTIADFRKDNGNAIREVCRAFVLLCRQLDLLSEASVAIDGSKFKAVNARDNNFTQAKMKRRLERIDESITRYMEQLVTADRQIAGGNDAVPQAKVDRLKDKIAKLKEEVARLNAINKDLQRSEDEQISLTDPDSRSMATSGKDTGIVGYNVQSAVDTKHHLIVAHEVTNVGSDRNQLAHMAEQARVELGAKKLDVLADRGYYDSEQIKACEDAGISVMLPKPQTSGAKSQGRFGKQDFVYKPEEDAYRCPAGETLPYRYTSVGDGKTLRRYWTVACKDCRLKSLCTPTKERRISRWEHEAVLEKVQARTRSHSGSHDHPPLDRRASVRHDQMLDGGDALSVHHAAEGGNGDGAQRARLQHEARDEYHRCGQAAGGHTGGDGQASLEYCAPTVAPGRLQAVTGRDLAPDRCALPEQPDWRRGPGQLTQV